jgi:hypothetical protein
VQSRDLITQRLTAAGGHQDKGVLAPDEAVNDLLLGGPKGGVAEYLLEAFQGGVVLAIQRSSPIFLNDL